MNGLFARLRHYLEEQRLQPDINRGLRATVGFMGAFLATAWWHLPLEASFATIAAQTTRSVMTPGVAGSANPASVSATKRRQPGATRMGNATSGSRPLPG